MILFGQSLYMFADMRLTLEKAVSLLTPDGLVLIACERLFENAAELWGRRRIAECLSVSLQVFLSRLGPLSARVPRDASGRFNYRDEHYRRAVGAVGLEYRFRLLDYALHSNRPAKAGNYFGVKVSR